MLPVRAPLRSPKKSLIAIGIAGVLHVSACSSDPATTDGAGGTASGGAGSGGESSSGGSSSGGALSGGASSGGAASGGDVGSGGDAAAEACHDAGPAGELTTRLPCLLSQTGLYEADMVTLAAGVHAFSPMFPLWTDGAEKKRWIALPEGTKIDTTDMDNWQFPVGTKLWKEFVRDDVRVETRMIEKQESGNWYMVAYQWRPDQTEADAIPNGLNNASGTEHDVPNVDACTQCHGERPDNVLGFSAIQLSHDPGDAGDDNEWTLQRLMDADLLTAPPSAPFDVPGTDVERSFFGYVHGNCAHCHNPDGAATEKTGLDLALKVEELEGAVNEFSIYEGMVDQPIGWADGERPEAALRIDPGNLENSAVYQRFLTKGQAWSMPPVGTEVTDPAGQAAMEAWIASLE